MILQDQIDELKTLAPHLSLSEEGGISYIKMEGLKLPQNCSPASVTALLRPANTDGYNCRMYFSERPTGTAALNWQPPIRILLQQWHYFSYQTQSPLKLREMVAIHLNALRV